MNIPDEAVEAAARSLYEVFPSLADPNDESTAIPWTNASEQRRAEDRAQARAALEAAAPHLMASAWEQGHAANREVELEHNPYRKPTSARVPTEAEQAEIDAFQNGAYGAEPPVWWLNRA